MAAKKVHGTTVDTVDTGVYLYSAMSDGVILRQWRYEGRLETATIFSRQFRGQDLRGRLVLRDGILRVRKVAQ